MQAAFRIQRIFNPIQRASSRRLVPARPRRTFSTQPPSSQATGSLGYIVAAASAFGIGWIGHTYFSAPREQFGKYGSPNDFDKGIRELRVIFPEEGKVTTDADDLYEHGVSIYDYHSGMYSPVHPGLLLF